MQLSEHLVDEFAPLMIDLDLDATMVTNDALKQKLSHTLSSMVFQSTCLGPLRKVVQCDHSKTISIIGFWKVRSANPDLYHATTCHWNWVKFGNILPWDGINLLTVVTSRNKLLDILCYPFPKELFEYFGPSAMDPDVATNGTNCIAVTRSHVNTLNDAFLLGEIMNHQ